jgi:chromosome segregation ATPase
MRGSERFGAALIVVALLAGAGSAKAQDNPEDRLRAQLRSVTVQLRQLQDQNADLQAKQAEAERARLDLAQKLAADEQELAQLRQHDKDAANALQQSSSRLDATSAALEAERRALSQSQTAVQTATAAATDRDAEAKRLDAAMSDTRKQLGSCQEKNDQLIVLGNQILDLYKNKNVFDALIGAEPITGLKRVAVENQIQDYQDKLLANKFTR